MIRPYASADLDGVLHCWYQASLVATPFLTSEFLEQERHNIEHLYLPNTKTWVSEEDGEVVGFIAMMDNEIGGLFLLPNRQRKGLGSAFVDFVAKQHQSLVVEVFSENKIGSSFYEKVGFQFVRSFVHEPTGQTMNRLEYQKTA